MQEEMRQEPYRFEFIGGEPCLDLVNTVGGVRPQTPKEHLHDFADLVAWARQGELITTGQARALLLRAQREPAAADAALAAAVELRAAIIIFCLALAEGGRQPPRQI